MKKFLKSIIAILAMTAVSCETADIGQEGDDKPQQGTDAEIMAKSPAYVNANLVYYGDYGSEGTSDWWVLTLYTDMEVEGGYPIGPGQMVALSLNTVYNPDQTADPAMIAGTYHAQSGSMDFSPGTFMPGYEETLSLPTGGDLVIASDTFYADIAEGETEFDADCISYGDIAVTANGDGTYTVSAILTGDQYLKRYVYYSGPLKAVDGSYDPEANIPNSNLTSDLQLDGSTFTKAKLIDYGPSFGIPTGLKERYKKYCLIIAEDGIDLSQERPSGTGRLLRIETFVPDASTLETGLPAGEYTIAKQLPDGGILGEDITTFTIVQGYPNRFEDNYGTWYQELKDGAWVNYARITDGTMSVARDVDGYAYSLDIIFKDCSDPAFTISCNWKHADVIDNTLDRNIYD